MFKKFWNWLTSRHTEVDENYERLVAWWKVHYAALDWSGDDGGHPIIPAKAPETAQEPSKQPCTTCPSLGPCQKHQEASDALEEQDGK